MRGAWRALPVAAVAFVVILGSNLGAGALEIARGAPKGVPPATLSDVQYILDAILSGFAGLLIAWRRPSNVMWRLLVATGLAGGLFGLTTEYTMRSRLVVHSTGFLPDAAAWLSSWCFVFIPATIALILLMFPTGTVLTPRWRWLVWLVLVELVLSGAGGAFHVGWVQNRPLGALGPIHNPLAVPSITPLLDVVSAIANGLLGIVFAGAIVSLVLRYRRGTAEERQQLKILTYVAAFAPLGFLLYPFYSSAGPPTVVSVGTLIVGTLGAVGFPVAILVAILKYGLYDIDVVISRTLVYGALAAFITLVYVGIVVGIGTLIGQGSRPNLGLSIVATAVVAVGFEPLRERLQKVANRLVYGNRATPYEVLSDFSQRVAESYAADDVLPRMARVLADGTGAERTAVWLRAGAVLRPAAVFPGNADGLVPLNLAGQLLPTVPGADRTVPVRHQGELLGALSVTKRRGEALTPIEEKLLDDLAHQAGLVLKNVGLTADLQARLEDLRESRKRLVAAQDQERRRLERNLHDGAQQHLVALKVKLGLAEMLAAKDPEKAKATLAELKSEADEALETLRDLARGIYPPLLADKGLVAALEAQARKATLPVTVESDGIGRYPQEVEAAVYFCVLEALQNVQKYARANLATVRLAGGEGQLGFEVEDDGTGFDPATAKKGAGLTNMADRLDALGGRLEVEPRLSRGALVRGSLPTATVMREAVTA